MGKFNFSRNGRRKTQDLQPTVGTSMSKAHKILGSTPLNIDSPVVYDDAPTFVVSTSTFESTGPSDFISDDEFESLGGQVRVAGSDEEWGGERGPSPASLRVDAFGENTSFGGRTSPMSLKKTKSSSTIKSWHDLSGHQTARQMSSAVIAKGPSKAQQLLHTEGNQDRSKLKKKPTKLDFSHFVPGSRLSKKVSQNQLDTFGINHMNQATNGQCGVIPNSLVSHRHSDLRSILKRRTKESLRSFLPDASPVITDEASPRNPTADNGLSTLYDHYEQMTFRQVMQQEIEDDSSPLAEDPNDTEWEEAHTIQEPDWFHKPIDESLPPTASQSSYSSSPEDGDRSVSSRHTRTSKASKQTERSLPDVNDFHDKSVLILSSDSEDEEYEQPPRTKPVPTARLSSDTADDISPPPSLVQQIPERGKQQKPRTSFAPANTYITIPSAEVNLNPATPIHKKSKAHEDSLRSSSPKPSLVSTNSTASGMTCQVSCGVEETSHVTSLPARRPSQAEIEQTTMAKTVELIPVKSHEALPTSPGQLTPPLSPSSVDFYLRSARSSARSSVDDGGQSRIMALTRQEEMLISALRKKTQAMREKSKVESESLFTADEQQSRGSNASQGTLTEASILDFNFPVPPTHVAQRQSEVSVIYSPTAKHPQSTDRYAAFSQEHLLSTIGKDSIGGASQGTQDSAEHQEVVVFLDQSSTTSDWDHFPDNDDEPAQITSDFQAISWNVGQNKASLHDRADLHHISARRSECLSPTATSRLATLSEDDIEDTPRPDSPISPSPFTVARDRSPVRNTARLSAVGFARPMNEFGWWGDDD